MTSTAGNLPSPTEGSLPLTVIYKKNGFYYIERIALPEGANPVVAVDFVLQRLELKSSWLRISRIVVHTVTVTPLSKSLPGPPTTLPVFIESKVRDDALTSIFRAPDTIAHVTDFAALCTSRLNATLVDEEAMITQGLLLGWEVKTELLIALFALSLLLPVIVGVIAGVSSKNARLALALSGVIYALIQTVVALLPWYSRTLD